MTFQETLISHGVELTRENTTWLQLNVGLACDLACKHCHLEAGPHRTESMSAATVDEVIACAGRFDFPTIDITGGAPELMPHLSRLVTGLAPLTAKLIIRTNLVALARPESQPLLELYRRHQISLVASLPALVASQTDAMRGSGVCATSLAALQQLNNLGYGQTGSGLELNLAVNPAGAFLPVPQHQAEERFRKELLRQHGICFNQLFSFANVPLGRFRNWLERSGNLDDYLLKLKQRFNPGTLDGLMCCSLISVNWDGYLYDCDFNLAASLPHRGVRQHISSLTRLPAKGTPIAIGEHCFACTAGSGFSCGGSIAA